MSNNSAMFAIGLPGDLPRLWAEGEVDFVRLQVRPGEVAQRMAPGGAIPVPQPLPATSDI